MLLSVAKYQPHWEFTGQDVDHRAVQMTAINLGLNGLRGWAVWQNTLTLECHRVYRIGMNWSTGGVVTEIPVDQSPFNYQANGKAKSLPKPDQHSPTEVASSQEPIKPSPDDSNGSPPPTQLEFF